LNFDELAVRVRTLIERRRFSGAETDPGYATLAPGRPLALLAAQFAIAEGRLADAATTLDDALAVWPEDGALLRLRTVIALASHDPARAALAAADAVIADRDDAEAESLLDQAVLLLASAAARMPHAAPLHNRLLKNTDRQ
jgi:hypothetical protein